MAINLFVDRNVNHLLLGIYIPTSSYWAFNGFWIIVLAPVLAMLYTHFGKSGLDLTIAMKFALGIIIMGLGFLILTWSTYFADGSAQVSAWWIVWSYFLQSLAELLVSAIGLSMIIRLAPPKLFGMMMGAWFLGNAAASVISGQVAKLASVPQGNLDPHLSLHIYGHAFLEIGIVSIGVGLVALILVPTLNRLTAEKTQTA
jgi:POT family proton-dependent oligopeptide transporter